ncbi:Cell 5a endo-1,4-betaglucanase, partial [Globisporangium splendens]
MRTEKVPTTWGLWTPSGQILFLSAIQAEPPPFDEILGNPTDSMVRSLPKSPPRRKNGKIVAVSSNGTEVPIDIKGVNWFGMETFAYCVSGQAIPFGLWDNDTAGTTAYHVAEFLSTNKFNAVRLPLMVQHILNNTEPNKDMINSYSNLAVSIKNYMALLKSVVKVLQFRRIGVLVSMHTLTNNDSGGLWYNENLSEKDFLKAVDLLTSNLCNDEYWNVMGLDVKNEPFKATWGTGEANDFRIGAKTIMERMLAGCPKWLGFVEGLNYRAHDVVIDGEKFTYNDWYGGGLQDAKKYPIELNTEHKIVWAPHYYTSAVFVQPYFYGGGTTDPVSRVLKGFVELSDAALKNRVAATMEDMFGYLVDENPQYAVVLGEFGGIYAKDEHPKKTIQRTVDYNIEVMLERGYAGGFLWSLNPESKYQYVSWDKGSPVAAYEEGLVELDWLTANTKYLNAMKHLDKLPDLRRFPCLSAEKA